MSIFNNFRKISALQVLRAQLPRPAAAASAAMSSSSTSKSLEYATDPQPLFTDPETQRLLHSMNPLQLDKVFRQRTLADNSVDYKFMTTEQLEEEFERTVAKARHRLQMAPVVAVKADDVHRIISQDAALRGFSTTKFVITDITYGLRQSERKVIVRQTDGTLEYAPLAMAKRMRQIYFPQTGRKLRTPRMFEPEHLDRCLAEHKYEFVLDRLLAQYEPYEAEFHRISARVYQHLNEESRDFDALRSTRHFGPMAFFYAWHRCIDDLLYDMIRRDYLANGADLIALMYKVHNISGDHVEVLQRLETQRAAGGDPALAQLRKSIQSTVASDDMHEEIKAAIGKTREDFATDELCLQLIDQYIAGHALKKVQLELAVQTLKEINAEKKQLFEGLSKAHGIQ